MCHNVAYPRRLVKLNMGTVRQFIEACKCGSKYIYQALPRLLTLYFNVGDDDAEVYKSDEFTTMNLLMRKAIKNIPMYKVSLLPRSRWPWLMMPGV